MKKVKKIGWQTLGHYEYEYGRRGYTGWCRCIGGRMADGLYPEFNYMTGEIRYS
jgi:hypothetical protein